MLGRSVLQEILRTRIQQAQKLLASTDLSMPIVAKRSGFTSAPSVDDRLSPHLRHAPYGLSAAVANSRFLRVSTLAGRHNTRPAGWCRWSAEPAERAMSAVAKQTNNLAITSFVVVLAYVSSTLQSKLSAWPERASYSVRGQSAV